MLKNTQTSFGWLSKTLHWLMAILIMILFSMGLYMTSLDYYDPLYHSLPWWHKSLGLLTFSLLLIRFSWKFYNPQPKALGTHKKWENRLAHLLQRFFYLLILAIAITGYLISTAKGKGIAFFHLFKVPAITAEIEENIADLIGSAHEILAISLIILVLLHTVAALKHHFIDRDETLARMTSKK